MKQPRLTVNQRTTLEWLAENPNATQGQITAGVPGRASLAALLRRSLITVRAREPQARRPVTVYSVTERGQRCLR